LRYEIQEMERKRETRNSIYFRRTWIVESCRKYGVSTGTFYSWRKKYDTRGEVGLKVSYDSRSKELKQAEEENRILSKLLSNKEIELEIQRELLKKSLEHRIQERFSQPNLS